MSHKTQELRKVLNLSMQEQPLAVSFHLCTAVKTAAQTHLMSEGGVPVFDIPSHGMLSDNADGPGQGFLGNKPEQIPVPKSCSVAHKQEKTCVVPLKETGIM